MKDLRMAVFTCSAQSGAAISAKNGILSLLEGHFFRPENIDIYYTYSVRKLSTTPDSNVLEDLAEKGLRLFPIILPEEYVAFVQKSENINNNKKLLKLTKKLVGKTLFNIKKLTQLNNNYDIFWINQLPYCPILNCCPLTAKFIFAREVMWRREDRIINLIGKESDGIIAIDKITAEPFLEKFKHKVRILRNPLDMGRARELKKNKKKCEEFKIQHGIPTRKKIITLVGNITPIKGTDFFLDLAKKYKHKEEFFFLIIGSGDFPGNRTYYKNIVLRARSEKNVKILCGDESFMQKIYAITDLNLRCDPFFPLGRTVWESLYSGVPVLLPVRPDDDVEEVKEFLGKQIFLYEARKKESLFHIFENVIYDIENLEPLPCSNNLHEYSKELWEFMTSKINCKYLKTP